jgi:GNAT superfamily N-acetyltransferase
MSSRITGLSHSNLSKIPYPCRTCTYWIDTDKVKLILKEWGTCGFVIFEDNNPVGYTLFGPPSYFPKIAEYPAGPVGEDAIFLACMYIMPDNRGSGLGEKLLMDIEKHVLKRKYKALELFGSRSDDLIPANPIRFYLERGFYIKKDDDRFPLLRLDVKSLVAWQENVEAALKQLSKPLSSPYPKKAPVPL